MILCLKLAWDSVCVHFSCAQDGFFPLHNASQEGYIGIVDVLIKAGAKVDLQTKVGFAVALNVRSPSAPHIPCRAHWYLAGWVWWIQTHTYSVCSVLVPILWTVSDNISLNPSHSHLQSLSLAVILFSKTTKLNVEMGFRLWYCQMGTHYRMHIVI